VLINAYFDFFLVIMIVDIPAAAAPTTPPKTMIGNELVTRLFCGGVIYLVHEPRSTEITFDADTSSNTTTYGHAPRFAFSFSILN
jgi:hypothetical protein